jgi:general secretion pathway protein D
MTTCRNSMSIIRWRIRFFGSALCTALFTFSGQDSALWAQSQEPSKAVRNDSLDSRDVKLTPISSRTWDSELSQKLQAGPVDKGTGHLPGESVDQYLRNSRVHEGGVTKAQLSLPQTSSSETTGGWSPPATGHDGKMQAHFDQPQRAELKTAQFQPLAGNPTDKSATYQLEFSSMLRFEEALTKTYGAAAQVTASEDNRFSRWSLPSRAGKQMGMHIDRQSGLLQYEGDRQLQESWSRLMWQIDSKSAKREDGAVVRATAVFSNNIDDHMIRQTANWQDDRIILPGVPQDQQPTGNVTIIQDPNTGVITILAENEQDREIVRRFIESLNEVVVARQRQPRTFALQHVQAATIETRVKDLYDAAFQVTYGAIEVRSNPLNNTLIVVGLPDALAQVEQIVRQFDAPGDTQLAETFRAFRLQFISAVDARTRLNSYFVQSQQALGAGTERLPSIPVVNIPDFRSNTIIVKGSRQAIQEAELLLMAIDVDQAEADHQVKIVKVRNRLADELAVIVQDVINGQQFGAGSGFKGVQQQQQFGQQQQQQPGQLDNPNTSSIGAKSLMMQPENGDGEAVSSGILFDARITSDRDSNSIIISAPRRSIPLIELLINELDRVPDVEVQMKVFHIVNGDARELLQTLQTLFGGGTQQQAGFGQQALGQQGNLLNQMVLQTVGATPGSNLVNLRFAADPRTNTILATGPVGELQVVEALLNRLDETRSNSLQTYHYRLVNAPALDIADAINQWLTTRDTVNAADPRATGEIIQTDRRVIVVPEVVSNTLLIQAHPQHIDEVLDAIRAFDRRPPMVKVKVLLAEVDLSRLEEFGIDVGIQDSILFDRGTAISPAGAITSGIGFPFNRAGIGNVNAYARENLAGQGLSNLGTGRANTELGYGGLVLSAGNESVEFLLRALKNKRCVRVLSKPQIMTIENLQGRVLVGANVPRIAGTNVVGLAVTQDIQFQDVGVILEVTPRVSPDGMIVMFVNASKSSVGPESTGIVVGVGADGTVIRSPQILQTDAQTTLMARSGQTIVMAGLISETKSHEERGIPILSDLPVVGPLFRFESDRASRTELLIIMTPYLVTDDEDIEAQNQEEMDRIHWCLEDVSEIYGSTGHQVYGHQDHAVETIYPHDNPTGKYSSEPTPNR